MTREQKIEALAKLDGWEVFDSYTSIQDGSEVFWWRKDADPDKERTTQYLPPYLTSYDAIIPLVQKQPNGIMWGLIQVIHWKMTPEQIADALLEEKGLL